MSLWVKIPSVKSISFLFLLAFSITKLSAQSSVDPAKAFLSPPEDAKPWVLWHWLHGAVSAKGITADLEAMKGAGIGGAYLLAIKDTTAPSIYLWKYSFAEYC